MGVDYSASFGIGIEIDSIEDEYDDIDDYLEKLLYKTPYEYSQYGDGCCTGKVNTFLILLKDPFKEGYDITEKINKLKIFLDKNNIKYKELGLVGGVYCW